MAAVEGWALVDGRGTPLSDASMPVTDAGWLQGWVAFETLELVDGSDPGANLERLRQSAAALGIVYPGDELLRSEIAEVHRRVGPAWVRVDLTGSGRRVVWGTPIDPSRRHRGVRAARAAHVDHPWLPGAVKHRSRAAWAAETHRRGVDELLLVDAGGRFTEATNCAIVAVVSQTLYTAPWDGRILESTTLAGILAKAAALGITVHREGALASGPWQALYIASTTRHLAPVLELDGEALDGWDDVGRALIAT
jgi:branched-chain amino acid aminotransferase